jgi:hypothetical protein
MRVILFFKNDMYTPENIFFDLHFKSPSYTIPHKIIFEDAPLELVKLVATPFSPSESNNSKKRLSSPTPSTHSLKKTKHSKTASYPQSPSPTSSSPALPSPIVNKCNDLADKKPHAKEAVVDDIYNQDDLKSASPIHSDVMDEGVKKKWNIPEVCI